jgi:hypothetical protein
MEVIVRRSLERIAPTSSTKALWNVGSVNAIEKDINSGSAACGNAIIPDSFLVCPCQGKQNSEESIFARWPRCRRHQF